MSDDFVLTAELREDVGKGASRRLRRQSNKVPAIIYGGTKKPQAIMLEHNEFAHALENEAFYSHIITLNAGDKSQEVILKDLQRHPSKPKIVHADFLRVSKTTKLTTRVPLHYINEEKCVGVKTQGGVVSHTITELEIQCLPQNLPEYIEIDLIELEIGKVFHISDINLPKGVESVALIQGEDHDLPVVSVNKPKGNTDTDAGEEAAEAEGESEEGGED